MGAVVAVPTVPLTDREGSWDALVAIIERFLLPRLETFGDKLFAAPPSPSGSAPPAAPSWCRLRRSRMPQFVFVLSGQGRLVVNGETLVLKAGQGCFLPRHTLYAPHPVTDEHAVPCDWLWLQVHAFGVAVVREQLTPTTHFKGLPHLVRDQRLVDLFAEWERERQRPNPNPIVTKGLLCAFFGLLIRSTPSPLVPVVRPKVREQGLPPPLRAALALFHAHYDKPLHLATIAHACGVSPHHLCRLFRRYLAVTPWQYLERLRLEVARQLLRSTDLGVGDIAFLSGFHSLRHFQRLFRRTFGVSPTAFRRRPKPLRP